MWYHSQAGSTSDGGDTDTSKRTNPPSCTCILTGNVRASHEKGEASINPCFGDLENDKYLAKKNKIPGSASKTIRDTVQSERDSLCAQHDWSEPGRSVSDPILQLFLFCNLRPSIKLNAQRTKVYVHEDAPFSSKSQWKECCLKARKRRCSKKTLDLLCPSHPIPSQKDKKKQTGTQMNLQRETESQKTKMNHAKNELRKKERKK